MDSTIEKSAFAQLTTELEKLVSKLESPDVELESSLAHYERAMEIVHQARISLEAAEQKIMLLNDEKDGSVSLGNED